MPPRNDPPKKFSKLLYFRGLFCQTQSQTPLLTPPTARHTEVFSFFPPCKLGGNMPPAFWCRGSSGRAMCPRAVWCRGSSGRAMCPRAVWCRGIVQGVPCVRVPSGALASFRACHVSACRLVPWHRSGRAMSSHTYIYNKV